MDNPDIQHTIVSTKSCVYACIHDAYQEYLPMDNVKGLKQLKDQDRGPAEEEDEHHHRQHRHHLQLISGGRTFYITFYYPKKDFHESLIASCVTNHHCREARTCLD